MAYMSYIVCFLRLVKIIPGGKHTLLDRIALVLWTLFSVVLSAAFLNVNWEIQYNIIQLFMSNKISVISGIFLISSGFFIPCLSIVSAFPALHYLVSTYPHVSTDKCLPSLQHSWLFLASTVLCFSAALASTVGQPFDRSFFYVAVNITTLTYWHCLMIISSLMIGISTSQIKTKMDKNAIVLLTKDSVSECCKNFKNLKQECLPYYSWYSLQNV